MVKIEKMENEDRDCNSCTKEATYKVLVGYRGQNIAISLCEECLHELLEQLENEAY